MKISEYPPPPIGGGGSAVTHFGVNSKIVRSLVRKTAPHQSLRRINGLNFTISHASVIVLSNSYTMGCPPVRGDNPRALASGLSYVQVDKNGITILYHLHQCNPCTPSDSSC